MKHIHLFEEYLDNMDDFPHIYQHKGYVCGTTSIKMILKYLKYPDNISLDYLEKITGTNDQVGCTDVFMAKGLDTLGVKYKRIVGLDKEKSFEELNASLLSNKKIILRTLTSGIKHWIVVYKYDNGTYFCADPWQGKIRYTENDIISIWKPRNYDAFIILEDVESRPVVEKITSEKDKEECLALLIDVFKDHISPENLMSYIRYQADWKTSVKLVLNDKIIGCYLLKPRKLHEAPFENLNGIEGIALAIKEEFRNFGYGKMLISYSENLDYDFIFGQHLKSLNNIDNWKKRRDYVYDMGGIWITAKFLK